MARAAWTLVLITLILSSEMGLASGRRSLEVTTSSATRILVAMSLSPTVTLWISVQVRRHCLSFSRCLLYFPGHGTHVAGIIAADPNNGFNITGVAYESTLTAYRIFGCTGSTTDDIIVQALLQGAKDGANVLNLSLGGPDGWTTSVASVVASRLARSGIVLAIAAGNEVRECLEGTRRSI